jgi:hypothetical protein
MTRPITIAITLAALVLAAHGLMPRSAEAQRTESDEAASDEAASAETVSEPDVPPPAPESPSAPRHWVSISLGFNHWFGDTFGSPPGVNTPALSVGAIVLEWLELGLSYSVAVASLPLPDGTEGHVGFLTLSALLRHELRGDGRAITVGAGLVGGFDHSPAGVRPALGVVILARLLFDVGDFALGPYFDFRPIFYELAESPAPLFALDGGSLQPGHSDAHAQLGVVLVL